MYWTYSCCLCCSKSRRSRVCELQYKVEVIQISTNGLMVPYPNQWKGDYFRLLPSAILPVTEKGFRVIEGLNKIDIDNARKLLSENRITLSLNRNYKGLYIKVVYHWIRKIRVITRDSHLNIVNVKKIPKDEDFKPFLMDNENIKTNNKSIQQYDLEDFKLFSTDTHWRTLLLAEGIDMNRNCQRGTGKRVRCRGILY